MELRRVGGEIFSEIQYKTSSVSLTSQTVLRPTIPFLGPVVQILMVKNKDYAIWQISLTTHYLILIFCLSLFQLRAKYYSHSGLLGCWL